MFFQRDSGPVSPSFTDLAELVSRINPPSDPPSQDWPDGRFFSNLLVSDADVDDYSGDPDVYLARRARSGSLSDQDLDSDYPHGVEEAGYEVSGWLCVSKHDACLMDRHCKQYQS